MLYFRAPEHLKLFRMAHPDLLSKSCLTDIKYVYPYPFIKFDHTKILVRQLHLKNSDIWLVITLLTCPTFRAKCVVLIRKMYDEISEEVADSFSRYKHVYNFLQDINTFIAIKNKDDSNTQIAAALNSSQGPSVILFVLTCLPPFHSNPQNSLHPTIASAIYDSPKSHIFRLTTDRS